MTKLFNLTFFCLLLWLVMLPILWNDNVMAEQSRKVYTIQVMSSERKEDILNVARRLSKTIPGTRVDKISNLYVLRIGKFQNESEVSDALKAVRKFYGKAYIRTAYDMPEREIFNDLEKEGGLKSTVPKPSTSSAPQVAETPPPYTSAEQPSKAAPIGTAKEGLDIHSPGYAATAAKTEIGKVYTIQVMSSKRKENILNVARHLSKTIPGTRVDKISNLYVLRVGKFQNESEASDALKAVRKSHRRAYIRTAYDMPEREIFNDLEAEQPSKAAPNGTAKEGLDIHPPGYAAAAAKNGSAVKVTPAPPKTASGASTAPANKAVTSSERLTIKQSVDIALNKSVVVQSTREGVTGAEAARKEAFTNFLPKVSTSYSYQRFNKSPELKLPERNLSVPAPINTLTIPASVTTIGTQDNYSWALEVKQPLFTGGAIVSNYLANNIGEEIARTEQQTTIQNVTRDVTILYFNVLKAQRLLDVARQSLERLKSHREMTKRFFEEGLIARNGLLAADVELAGEEQALVSAENGVELAKSQFNIALRKPLGSPVELEDVLEYIPYEKPLESCLKEAMENSPDIRSYILKTQQAGKLVDVTKSEYYPNVNVVGHYELYGDTPGVQGSDYKDSENWYIMAVASWNLWEWGKTKNRVIASRSRENQMNCALTNIQEQTTLEVKSAWLSLREAEKRIMVSGKAIVAAEENYKVSQARYKGQMGTFTEVLDAQTLLTKANADHFNNLGDYHIAIARLERAVGTVK